MSVFALLVLGACVLVSPSAYAAVDSDGDSVSDIVEEAAPNSGDNNYDGVVDSDADLQNTVASTPNPNDTQSPNSYVTLQVGNPQTVEDGEFSYFTNDTNWHITKFEPVTAPTENQPDNTVFPLGMFDIELACNNNFYEEENGPCVAFNDKECAARTASFVFNPCFQNAPADLKLIFNRVMDTSNWTTRKYDASSGQYVDYSPYVTIANEVIGFERTTVTWTIFDGEFGDDDHEVNGIIKDPIGPSVPVQTIVSTPAAVKTAGVVTSTVADPTLAPTGASSGAIVAIAVFALIAGLGLAAKEVIPAKR